MSTNRLSQLEQLFRTNVDFLTGHFENEVSGWVLKWYPEQSMRAAEAPVKTDLTLS